jgi:hypothetical protein
MLLLNLASLRWHPQYLLRMGRHILFKCPQTGTNVQHWLAEGIDPDDPRCTYETVVCRACTKLHFIHKETGKLLLGHEND